MSRENADFETIMAETEARVRAYIAGMGVSLDTVDDIAQEVYLTFNANMDKMPDGVEPIRWLKGMARNLCMNYFRQSKRLKHLETMANVLVYLQDTVQSSEKLPNQQESLRNCLEKLAPKQRQIIGLRYEKGLKSNAIAEILGSGAVAVRVALMRTLNNLRDCMEQNLPQALAEGKNN